MSLQASTTAFYWIRLLTNPSSSGFVGMTKLGDFSFSNNGKALTKRTSLDLKTLFVLPLILT